MTLPPRAALATTFALAFTASALSEDYIRGVYCKASPEPVVVPRSAAWDYARSLARATPGASLSVGNGDSMHPLYPSGTILVVAPRAFPTLERGMSVIYRNRKDRAVCHVLVAKVSDGWRITGLGNEAHDSDGVREDNLIGVVVAAVTPGPKR